MADSPVVLLNGARQTGKTTLIQASSQERRTTYLSLDDVTVLAAARLDPDGFLAGFSGPLAIDEVQHAPELFRALKLAVDRDRTPGRFLLTGSANVLLLPKLAESLAGRMEILTLWPLAQAEIEARRGDLIDRLFAGDLPASLPVDRDDLISRLLRGGYPERHARSGEARRNAWFGAYITTILQRDVRELANIEGLTAMPRLLTALAARAGNLLNLSDVSRTVGIPHSTLQRYMTLLETTFLVQLLPAWSAHIGKRLVHAPKVILNDTGLLASLVDLTSERLRRDNTQLGALLENFVVMEFAKFAGWSRTRVRLLHFRTQTGQEVDLVLESGNGGLVGIEVKASSAAGPDDFNGLRHLAEFTGDRFVRGVVLYTGERVVPFGPNLHAVPISALWSNQ